MLHRLLALLLVPAASLLAAAPAAAQNLLWVEQLGSDVEHRTRASAPDGNGGVYVGGERALSIVGPSLGGWIAHYDSAGAQLWIRQFSSSGEDSVWALASDGAGGVLACGETSGDLGGPNSGSFDAWFARFDGAGNLLWMHQSGTPQFDIARGITSDGQGGFYASGVSAGSFAAPSAGENDAWVGRFDGAGIAQWIRQLGSPGLDGFGTVALDATGGVFVGGATSEALAGPHAGEIDALFGHFDGAGSLLWMKQLGTSGLDSISALVPDPAGGIYAAMLTEGALGGPWQGDTDVCLGRFDATGAKLWLRQIGSDSLDSSTGLAPDGAGGVYFGGWTLGAFGGSTFGNFGHQWASRYDTSGTQLSLAQFGSQALGFTHTFASDGAGGVYIGGETSSPLGGPHSQVGAVDAFVARYTDACPPVTTYCTASATSIPGCQASISTGGTPHLSDGLAFTLSSGAVPGGNLGLCLFGWNGPASLPLGSLGGSLCVQSPFFRSAPHAGGGLAGQCNGQVTFTLQDLIDAAPAFSAGTALNAQLWVRDAANPDSFLLSDGVQFTVCL